MELSRAVPVDGREQRATPQLQILWKISLQRIHRGMKGSAGLAEEEIKPESTACTALVGGVPFALQAGGGASCAPAEAIMTNIFY